MADEEVKQVTNNFDLYQENVKREIESLKDVCVDFAKSCQQKEKEFTAVFSKLKETEIRFSENVDGLQKELETLKTEMIVKEKKLKDDNKILNGNITKLHQDLQAVQSTSSRHLQDLQTQKNYTEHWHNQFQQQLLNAQECTRNLEKSREVCRELEKEKNSLVLRGKQLERDKSLHIQQYADLKRLEDDNKILNGNITKLHQDMQAVQSTSSRHLQDLQTQKTYTDHWHNQFQQQLLNAQECTRNLEKSREVCKELEQEKNSLVLRVIKIAGDNLAYKNPNIADLGDPRRPTKLAEVYNELYDNEWTDAFDRFGDFTDTEKIKRMLTIIKLADDHCDELYKQHIDAVRNVLTTFSINYKTKKKVDSDMQRREDDKNETTRQTIKPDTNTDATREERDVLEIDYTEKTERIPFEFDALNKTQKQAFEDIGRLVQNAIEEKAIEVTSKVIVEEMELPDVSDILSYVRKCVTFCWSARLHDPPLYIDFMEVTEDTLFDVNVYKPYTKTGKLVDYVVWPPIYLHNGGPMLSKGVAQGKKKN